MSVPNGLKLEVVAVKCCAFNCAKPSPGYRATGLSAVVKCNTNYAAVEPLPDDVVMVNGFMNLLDRYRYVTY